MLIPVRYVISRGGDNSIFFFIIYIVQISKIDPRHTPIPTPAENIDILQTPSTEKEFLNPRIAHVIINLQKQISFFVSNERKSSQIHAECSLKNMSYAFANEMNFKFSFYTSQQKKKMLLGTVPLSTVQCIVYPVQWCTVQYGTVLASTHTVIYKCTVGDSGVQCLLVPCTVVYCGVLQCWSEGRQSASKWRTVAYCGSVQWG